MKNNAVQSGRGFVLTCVFVIGLAGILLQWPPLAYRIFKNAAACLEVTLLMFALSGWGRWALRRLDIGESRPGARLVAGALCVSAIVYVMAAGGMYHVAIGLLIVIVGLALHGRPALALPDLVIPFELAPILTVFVLCVGTPVIFWDCLAYHLAIPEMINTSGRVITSAAYPYSYYPLAMEMLYTILLGFPFGETASQILNIAFMIVAIRTAVSRLGNFTAAAVAAATITGLADLAYFPKNSALMALCGAVAYNALFTEDSDETESFRLAGIALGLGVFTHYGMLWVEVALLAAATARFGWRRAARVAGWSMIAPSILFVRNIIVAGNPMFPFFDFLFHDAPFQPEGLGLSSNLPLMTYWNRFMDPWTSLLQLGTVGPLIPLGLLMAWFMRDHRARQWMIRGTIALAIIVGGFVLHSRPRYGIAGVILLLPIAVEGLRHLGRWLPILCFVQATIAGAIILNAFDPLATLYNPDEEAYRARWIPSYEIARFASQSLPDTARIAALGIIHPYHWKGRLELGWEGAKSSAQTALENSPDDSTVISELRRGGYEYLAIDEEHWKILTDRYGYYRITPGQRALLERVKERSIVIASVGSAALYRLP